MTEVRPSPSASTVALALALDLVLVVVFAATGRASHDEAVFGAGLVTTAWPFATALLLGWAVSLAWRRPTAPLRTGLPVWAMTLVGGMLLRLASGQGVQLAFVIVAAIVLGIALIGWRGIAALVVRLRRRRAHA